MHTFAKRGLALIAATSGLALGTATLASADATTTAESAHSGGVVAGLIGEAPANLPMKLCGQNVQAGAVREVLEGTMCTTGTGVADTASSDRSGGVGSGDIVEGVLDAPVLFCGWNVNGLSYSDRHDGSSCAADASGPGATATAAVTDSGGVLSGDTPELGVNTPIDLCGNDVTLGTAENVYEGSTCTD